MNNNEDAIYIEHTLSPIADIPNRNGVIYSKEALNKAIIEYNKRIEDGSAFVVLNPSNRVTKDVALADVCGSIKSITENDGVYTTKVKILNTPAGNAIKSELSKITSFGINAIGNLNPDKTVTDVKIISVSAMIGDSYI